MAKADGGFAELINQFVQQMRGPLELERSQDHQNRATVGGIALYAENWAKRLIEGLGDQAAGSGNLIVQVLSPYPDLAKNDRRKSVNRALELLKAMERGFPQSQPEQSAQTHPPKELWSSPPSTLKNVGTSRAEKLAEAGLKTVGDLLTFFPYRYKDRTNLGTISELTENRESCLLVQVTAKATNVFRGRLRMTNMKACEVLRPCVGAPPAAFATETSTDANLPAEATECASAPISDTPGEITLRWFNQPYRANQFPPGTELVVAGTPKLKGKTIYFVVSECQIADQDPACSPGLNVGGLVPVYSHIEGISPAMLRNLIASALELEASLPEGLVPPEFVERRGLLSLREALWKLHFPQSAEDCDAARRRITYQEMLALQLQLARRQQALQKPAFGKGLTVSDALYSEYLAALDFAPTGAQRRVMAEITNDFGSDEPGHRLIHGDVGSGKTVVAAWALLCAARAGKQGAVMAPTELLAEQHFRTLSKLFESLGIRPLLLTGSMSEAHKREVREMLANGEAQVVVGTHALFQDSVSFADLAVTVIDEQHRFGLRQRAALAAKGIRPNVLVMSATPIPRTLALTLYGDFDISVIDELPPGRQPVQTKLLAEFRRPGALKRLAMELGKGHQAYVVCPLVAEGENGDLAATEGVYETLRNDLAVYPGGNDATLGLVHGQMPADEREAVMERFRTGDVQVLVSTTVIEVGVDVPNATMMVILNAERFGLAQLHQLRGRVARSSTQAYCVLLTTSRDDETLARLQVLETTTDGFRIAEEDMLRRGPGEMAGFAQHGLPDVHMAALLADTQTLVTAREDARDILGNDPALSAPELALIRDAVERQYGLISTAWAI